MKLFTLLTILVISTMALAKEEKILEITTDSNPHLTAEMSIDMTHAGLPTAITYTPDVNENKEIKFSLLQLLKSSVVLLQKTQVPVVSVKLNKINDTALGLS